jgi:acetyl esterase/lipase
VTASTNHGVDPALWPLVEGFPPIDLGPDTLTGFREAMVALSVLPEASSHRDVRIEELKIAGGGAAAQSIRCLLFTPTRRRPAAALLHIHGGGFVMGSPEMDVARNIELVRATGCVILSVDYRLAPEHPHPAALEDCHAALVWFAAQSEALGIPPRRLGVIGESAGGGLAASLALLARERATAELACQVLIYPMLVPPAQSLDASLSDARTGRYIWTRASNSYCWSAFLGGAGGGVNPADAAGTAGNASTAGSAGSPKIAGLASNFVGLPPTFIAVGELDLFVHDSLAYTSKLLTAGCSVEAHVYPGAIHGFDRMVDAPVSQRYTREMFDFVRRHLG